MNWAKANIAVLGGFGGLEVAFYLRMKLQERTNITLASDRSYFPRSVLTWRGGWVRRL